MNELERLKKDPVEFVEEQLGFKLYPFQKEMLKRMTDNPNSLIVWGGRTGRGTINRAFQMLKQLSEAERKEGP